MRLIGETADVSSRGWIIQEGSVICDTSFPGYLQTTEDYSDFVLELDYRLMPSGNSGIIIRARGSASDKAKSMEIQLIDDLQVKPRPESRSGAIYGAVAPRIDAARPAEQWNSLKIRCQREQVEVWINDIQVVDVEMFRVPKLQNLPRSGYIALYNWHGEAKGTQFRNIRITELK
jgi:hypothetical protein